MVELRPVTHEDEAVWYQYDRHLPKREFALKVRDGRGYVILDEGVTVGVLRYNLFWDVLPCLTLIYLDDERRGVGIGRAAMALWEDEMRGAEHEAVMTTTQVDEDAQHFYRKLGYVDKGSVVFDVEPFVQPMEMVMMKKL